MGKLFLPTNVKNFNTLYETMTFQTMLLFSFPINLTNPTIPKAKNFLWENK